MAWASHYLWVAFGPDLIGVGSHVVYGDNVLDCIHIAQAYATQISAGADHGCVMVGQIPWGQRIPRS